MVWCWPRWRPRPATGTSALACSATLREEARVPNPAVQRDEIERARQAAQRDLGDAGFAAAFDRGRLGDLAVEIDDDDVGG